MKTFTFTLTGIEIMAHDEEEALAAAHEIRAAMVAASPYKIKAEVEVDDLEEEI